MFANIQFNEFAGDSFYEVLEKIFRSIVPVEWVEAVEKYTVLFLILGLIIGISQCFFGYKLRKIWTGLDGMVVFGMGGAAIAVRFGLSIGTVVAVTVGAAVAGGLLGYFLWGAGIFLRVFSVVSVCVFAVGILYKLEALGLIIALAAGLIAAILTVAFVKIALIFYTSVAGALTAGVCVSKLFHEDIWYLPLIIGGILAVAGLAAQFITNRKRTYEAEESENESFMTDTEALAPEIEITGSMAGMTSGQAGIGNTNISVPEGTVGTTNSMTGIMTNGAETGSTNIPAPEMGTAGITSGVPAEAAAAMEAGAAIWSDLESDNGLSEIVRVCKNCGAEFPPKTKFCMKCGQRLI